VCVLESVASTASPSAPPTCCVVLTRPDASPQDDMPGGGVVVSNEIALVLDVEAMRNEDLERAGAIEHYGGSLSER
jgi:hypothetical protein